MSNTLWLTNAISAVKDQSDTFTVTVCFPDSSPPKVYEHVIDVVFNDGVVVLILENECVYYRAKLIKKWTAIKE